MTIRLLMPAVLVAAAWFPLPAAAQEVVPTTIAYTGGTSAQHAADLAASATLTFTGTDPDTGDPVEMGIEGREVTFTLRDGEGAEVQSATATTDATGTAATAVRLTAPVGSDYVLEAVFAGDEGYGPSSTTSPVEVLTAQTKLTFTGSSAGVRGATINLSARLQHVVTNDNLAGRELRFVIPGLLDTVQVTGTGGQGSVSFPLTALYGSYPLTITYEAQAGFAGATRQQTISITWSWTLPSAQGLGTVYLNDLRNEFQVVTPSVSSGIVTGADIQNHTPQFAQVVTVTARYASTSVALELGALILSPQLGGSTFEASGFIGTTPYAMARPPNV
jgi:hypothetical protein